MVSYLLFKKKKNSGDMIHEKFKTNRKMLKIWHYLQQQLESHFWPGKKLKFVFLYFYKSYRKFNFLLKKHQF